MKYTLLFVFAVVFSGCSDDMREDSVTLDEPAVQAEPKMTPDGTPEGTIEEPAEDDLLVNMRGNRGGGDSHPGKVLYDEHCTQCHNQNVSRAPDYSLLQQMPADLVLHSMREGLMQAILARNGQLSYR